MLKLQGKFVAYEFKYFFLIRYLRVPHLQRMSHAKIWACLYFIFNSQLWKIF